MPPNNTFSSGIGGASSQRRRASRMSSQASSQAASDKKKAGKKRTKSSGSFDSSKHPRAGKGVGGGRFIKASSNSNHPLTKGVGKLLPGKGDKVTEHGIKRFQRKNGLQVDGVVGRQTASALLGNKDAAMMQTGSLFKHQIHALRKKGVK